MLSFTAPHTSLRVLLALGCALSAVPLSRAAAETQVAGHPAYAPVTDERLANAAQDRAG